jgi:minor extracellular serine protease Vpr
MHVRAWSSRHSVPREAGPWWIARLSTAPHSTDRLLRRHAAVACGRHGQPSNGVLQGFPDLNRMRHASGQAVIRVPYYLVPRALSDVNAQMRRDVFASSPSTVAKPSNPSGPIEGTADFYAWGIEDSQDQGLGANDVRAVGVQSFTFNATNQLVVFAVNTWNRWSNAATNEFDILVDVDPAANNGHDYIVVGADQGAVQTGTFNGRMAAFVFSTRSAGASVNFFATAPTDSSSALLPILSTQLCRTSEPCLNAANPRFTYHINGFDVRTDGADVVPGVGRYNAWSSSISQGMFASVPRGASGDVPVTITPAEWALTPSLGLMIVALDNKAGKDEATLLGVTLK